MKRKRRNHSSSLKTKMALKALKYGRTLAELSEPFELDAHPSRIQDLLKRLLDKADTAFGLTRQQHEAATGQVKDLHAKNRQLAMEQDFLKQGLEKIHGPSGKK